MFEVEGPARQPDEDPFDRQKQISWWDQEDLASARVLVAGAGAIGNETLKNLALLGVRNFFIADFDRIETSNLSRTVLFGEDDVGESKATVARSALEDFCRADDPNVHAFDGDLVWELGLGVVDDADVVLGCVDNLEARLALNRYCWLTETPYIDAGIYELAAHVTAFLPPDPPCLRCTVGGQRLARARERYSCDDLKKEAMREGRTPTTQVTASLAASLQAQEAVKWLAGHELEPGTKLFHQGDTNRSERIVLRTDDDCRTHETTLPEFHPLPVTTDWTVGSFLEHVRDADPEQENPTLDLRGERAYVERMRCRSCTDWFAVGEAQHQLTTADAFCGSCDGSSSGLPEGVPTEKETLAQFSLEGNEPLDLTLDEVGVPPGHVVAVRDGERYRYYLLAGEGEGSTWSLYD